MIRRQTVKRFIPASVLVAAAAVVGLMRFGSTKPIDPATFDALYVTPGPAATTPQNVFHLGHSLVGQDMPVMLMQLAGEGHDYGSQLGWGTPLKAHWEPDEPINGFELRNTPPEFKDAKGAISSGDYNTLVLTEMVEILAAIKYFDSAKYLHEWIQLGRQSNPEMRVFFYETWHTLDDEEGWLERLDQDLERYWLDGILRVALAYEDQPQPVYIIPAGQIMARLVRSIEDQEGIGPITDRSDLFLDEIHLTDYGTYLIALAHYAVLYQKTPVGLPYELFKADGTKAESPGAEAAKFMQEIVWEVVTNYAPTGVPRQD